MFICPVKYVCLLKDGEIVFAIEEERISRYKYEGAPYAAIELIRDYTDKIDYLVVAHTQPDESYVDYRGGRVYTALAMKLKLIEPVKELFKDEVRKIGNDLV